MNSSPTKLTHAEWLAQGNPQNNQHPVPRRARTDLRCPAEQAVDAAIRAVEDMGGSPELTMIVNMLVEAGHRVSDVVDKPFIQYMSFGMALRLLQAGRRVRRSSWYGQSRVLFLVPGSTFTVNREPLKSILGEGTNVNYAPHIDVRDALEDTVSVWTPSQSDLMASDWVEVT